MAANRPPPERTEDGRWIVVDGRRWRATDPAIPGPLRQELVDELMAARRGVAAGAPDARRRVQHAKVALGERGEPWWEPGTAEGRGERIRAAVLALTTRRAGSGTICPSDVARVVGGDQWRGLMDDVRAEVRALVEAGEVEALQRGEPLDPGAAWRGPIRVRATAAPPASGGGPGRRGRAPGGRRG